MEETFDDKARLIQKIIAEFGWKDSFENYVERIKALDRGLVHEDEFLFLLSWVNNCKMFHRLDQSVILLESKKTYTIPDILATFVIDGEERPYLIEVKTTAEDKALKWKKEYYEGLVNYSKLIRVPMLVAWKWNPLDIWTLFDIGQFKKIGSSYKVDLETAHKENLMGELMGDKVIFLHDDFGLCIKHRKIKIFERDGNAVTWETVIEDVYYTGNGGVRVEGLDQGILAILMSLDDDVKTEEHEGYILNKYYPTPNDSTFLQSIPIRLVKNVEPGEIKWVDKIKYGKAPVTYTKLTDSLQKGLTTGIIKTVIHHVPSSRGSK